MVTVEPGLKKGCLSPSSVIRVARSHGGREGEVIRARLVSPIGCDTLYFAHAREAAGSFFPFWNSDAVPRDYVLV